MRSIVLAPSLVVSLLAAACVGQLDGGGGGGGDDDSGGDDDGGGPDAAPPDPPDTSVHVPVDAERPVDIMPPPRLGMIAPRMPHVADPWLRGILESPDTMWYDKLSIIPGYQDSFGDNTELPIGMRPNTIDRQMIDLAVPGGHAQLFVEKGLFHFPFGRGIGGAARTDNFVVDFWHVPRDGGGALRPVVWWWRRPTSWHRRIEWMFPKDTVIGEVLFKVAGDGRWFPFEIRTRTRRIDGWTFDAFRPFPTAASLADALERKRQERPAWANDATIDALIAHLRDDGTLRAGELSGPQFDISFPTLAGAEDPLPAVGDPTILEELLMETPFVSARNAVWKQSGSLKAYAATTDAPFSIVPRGYNAGFIEVADATCERCHRDAARPFKDYYPSIMLYGELWGEDETFSWHPFDNSSFVDGDGDVVGFGPPDNREFRADFEQSGLFVPYDEAVHGDDVYRKIPRDWKDYIYN
jgi:hypothetical protein